MDRVEALSVGAASRLIDELQETAAPAEDRR